MQKNPVKELQAVSPQTQGAGFSVAPSPWAQAGAVTAAHRQAFESASQEAVEAVFVLKYSLPPLVLLLLLLKS